VAHAAGGVAQGRRPLETLAGEPGAADGMEQRTLGYLDSLEAAARSLAALSPGVLVLAHA